jgi:hypothetical protein
MNRVMMRIVATLALLVAMPMAASSAQAGPATYPNVDRSVEIGSGETAHLLIRYVNDRGAGMVNRGKRLDFAYATKLPKSDAAGRQAQADRAAQVLGAQAVDLGMNSLSIGICDSEACAQRKAPPSDGYLYTRTNSGWKRVP